MRSCARTREEVCELMRVLTGLVVEEALYGVLDSDRSVDAAESRVFDVTGSLLIRSKAGRR